VVSCRIALIRAIKVLASPDFEVNFQCQKEMGHSPSKAVELLANAYISLALYEVKRVFFK